MMPIGHDAVIDRFGTALQRGRLHHAWLLHGMAGVGKAMLARELAAMFLCEHPARERACGECHACRMLAAGSHPDFQYVTRAEGKRDLAVDQVRETLAFLALSGMESEKRVVMLDDADTMNMQAANALLKGLEEPASGSLLLIVCHDLMRLPATIRSRCLLQHCAPLEKEPMRRALSGMALPADAETLALRLADGRPGRVAALQDAEIAAACLEWQRLTDDLATADVAAVQAWLTSQIKKVPHDLIAAIVLAGIEDDIRMAPHDPAEHQLANVAWDIAAWPVEVVRHSLRAGPTLLARLLQLRAVLRERAKVHA
jgi:DNA polymerase-3 subunit delta'